VRTIQASKEIVMIHNYERQIRYTVSIRGTMNTIPVEVQPDGAIEEVPVETPTYIVRVTPSPIKSLAVFEMRVETDGEPLVEAAAKLVQGYGIPGHLIHGFAN